MNYLEWDDKLPLTYEEALSYLGIIRDMIKHENELINQRIGWMFTLQGLLFGGIAFLWESANPIIVILGVVGILSCMSIGYSLNRGVNAIKALLENGFTCQRTQPSNRTFPPIIGSTNKAVEWFIPARLLPWVFGFAWVAVEMFYWVCPAPTPFFQP